MTKAELRTLFNQDKLTEAVVEPSLDKRGWIVEFRHFEGTMLPLTDNDGVECCFLNSDSASDHAVEIGFQQVRIIEE